MMNLSSALYCRFCSCVYKNELRTFITNGQFGHKWWTFRVYHIVQCLVYNAIWGNSTLFSVSLQWRHNGHDGVSNPSCLDCSLNQLFRCRSKKTSKLYVTGLCEGNPPVTGGFPSQRASNWKMLPFDVIPDSKVRGANMGPTWVLSAPDGPHVGPMNLAIRECYE